MRVLIIEPWRDGTLGLRNIVFCLIAGPIYKGDDEAIASTSRASSQPPINKQSQRRKPPSCPWIVRSRKRGARSRRHRTPDNLSTNDAEAKSISIPKSEAKRKADGALPDWSFDGHQYVHKLMRIRQMNKLSHGSRIEKTPDSCEQGKSVAAGCSQEDKSIVQVIQIEDDSGKGGSIVDTSDVCGRLAAECHSDDQQYVHKLKRAVMTAESQSPRAQQWAPKSEASASQSESADDGIYVNSTVHDASSQLFGSPQHRLLYYAFKEFRYRRSEVSKVFRRLDIVNQKHIGSARFLDADMMNFLYLRSRQKQHFAPRILQRWAEKIQKIRDSASNTSVKFICDWFSLLTLMPQSTVTWKAALRFLNSGASRPHERVTRRLNSTLEEYRGLSEAMKMERDYFRSDTSARI
eukprot:Blabericola_migrator_1__2160@NODE_1597_length_4203_cov_153_514749_g1031_i1_p2_GENE_NODE_1597_length_4203_cov_153_514749_g1031_i1NODE_1597_length_4203_cov_153_514749_g1031_i1_p2_ORF_typecomplete_len407_score46_39DUF4990/PF16380_5/0_13_NODE_1597_length_4203_cov_153_514749_g1031_i129284148